LVGIYLSFIFLKKKQHRRKLQYSKLQAGSLGEGIEINGGSHRKRGYLKEEGMSEKIIIAADVLFALDKICAGRLIKRAEDAFGTANPFVVTKTSHIPGKAVVETPGLVCGDRNQRIRKVAISMTLTESQLELAGGIGVDAIIVHHPVADAASSGGVPIRGYAAHYGVVIFEAHEAFHLRHPGMCWLHGHQPFRCDLNYGGVDGNIMYVGRALPEIRTAGEIIDRLADFVDRAREVSLLEFEREHRQCPELVETNITLGPQILCGSRDDKVDTVLHFVPHAGFTPGMIRQAKGEYPEITTAIVSVSRVKPYSPLVDMARKLGLTMLVGNSHALEIYENGMPLGYALQKLLPDIEVVLFRERVISMPVKMVGSDALRNYAQTMADNYLLKEGEIYLLKGNDFKKT
jgi:hypothetical protein